MEYDVDSRWRSVTSPLDVSKSHKLDCEIISECCCFSWKHHRPTQSRLIHAFVFLNENHILVVFVYLSFFRRLFFEKIQNPECSCQETTRIYNQLDQSFPFECPIFLLKCSVHPFTFTFLFSTPVVKISRLILLKKQQGMFCHIAGPRDLKTDWHEIQERFVFL